MFIRQIPCTVSNLTNMNKNILKALDKLIKILLVSSLLTFKSTVYSKKEIHSVLVDSFVLNSY